MKCDLSLYQIEKYTVETWPARECPIPKLAILAQEKVMATALAARMARLAMTGDVEQFQATVEELRRMMDNE